MNNKMETCEEYALRMAEHRKNMKFDKDGFDESPDWMI